MDTHSNDQVRERLAQIGASCVCNNLRRTARAVTNYYDGLLGPLSGLRVSQVSVLVTLYLAGPQTINELAEKLALDRTTLGRNLRPLDEKGLLMLNSGSDQRTRVVTLTAQGEEILLQVLPQWEEAQAHMVAKMHEGQYAAFLTELSDLTARTHEA